MERENNSKFVDRRKFLKSGSAFAAAAMFLPLGTSKIYGAFKTGHLANSIPVATLNNGVKMPMLGFGTNT